MQMLNRRRKESNITFVDDSAIESIELRGRRNETRILIADDNPQTLERLVATLDNGRRRIVATTSAGNAVDLLLQTGRKFDIWSQISASGRPTRPNSSATAYVR